MQMYNLDVKREDGRYAKVSDIYNQIHENFEDFPEEQICVKFNGEPSWNENVNLFLINRYLSNSHRYRSRQILPDGLMKNTGQCRQMPAVRH